MLLQNSFMSPDSGIPLSALLKENLRGQLEYYSSEPSFSPSREGNNWQNWVQGPSGTGFLRSAYGMTTSSGSTVAICVVAPGAVTEKEKEERKGMMECSAGTNRSLSHSLSQQDDVSQDTEHLVEARGLVHPLDDGSGELCHRAERGWPGDTMVAVLQQAVDCAS